MVAILIAGDYRQARMELIRNAVSSAHDMSLLVDKEFACVETSMETLATSPYLSSGNFAAFHEQARAVLRQSDHTNIVLSDASGKKYVNTLRPYGAVLPSPQAAPQLTRVAQTGVPMVTNLFIGRTTQRPVVAVGVPVRLAGQVKYVLSAGIFAGRFDTMLAGQHRPNGWSAAIVDRSGAFVAGRRELALRVDDDGLVRHRTDDSGRQEGELGDGVIDGSRMVEVFSRAPNSGWLVVLGVPTRSLESALRHRLAYLVLATLLLLGASLVLARIIGGRIARSVRALAGPALALGAGEAVEVPSFHLREADEVGAALVRASDMLSHARHRMNHDVLTGLANRALFQEIVDRQLAGCQAANSPLCVLYIDLDGFRGVNDARGHAIGDAVLRAVAERLVGSIRESDIAARLGGDEFAVLLNNTGIGEAENTAGKIVHTLSALYQVEGLAIEISASIGVAAFPESGSSSKALLHHADDAMYRAKALGKRRVVVDRA